MTKSCGQPSLSLASAKEIVEAANQAAREGYKPPHVRTAPKGTPAALHRIRELLPTSLSLGAVKNRLRRAKELYNLAPDWTLCQVDYSKTANKPASKKVLVGIGDEGIKERLLEQYGAQAFSRKYDPVVRWSLSDRRTDAPGTPMLFLSDLHYGEFVDAEQVWGSNEFDREICRARIRRTIETAANLLMKNFSRPDYPGIVLVLGGDLISGSLHDDQMATDEVAPLVQALEISKILADAVAFLAEQFGKVSVYCVPGNHGRTTRKPRAKFYAHNNLDWLACRMLVDHCAGLKGVDIAAPPVRDLNFAVAGHRYRLTHGDQFRGGDGIIGCIGPVLRGDTRKRLTASLMPGQPEAYDTMLCGHFHTLLMLPRLIVNGAIKGFDEFALSINVTWEPPQQAMWTVHPRYGHNWYMPIYSDRTYKAHPEPKRAKK